MIILMTLKQKMEAQWEKPVVGSPLRPARWQEGFRGLFPDSESVVTHQDERRPLDAVQPD